MCKIVPFKMDHLKGLLSQPMNKHQENLFPDEFLQAMEHRGLYITITNQDKVMACGGISPYWSGRGEVWCVFSEESKERFVGTFRLIKSWLEEQLKVNYRRIEVSICPELDVARRRAEMLGFKLETERARKYLPNGEDCSIYSMVRM